MRWNPWGKPPGTPARSGPRLAGTRPSVWGAKRAPARAAARPARAARRNPWQFDADTPTERLVRDFTMMSRALASGKSLPSGVAANRFDIAAELARRAVAGEPIPEEIHDQVVELTSAGDDTVDDEGRDLPVPEDIEAELAEEYGPAVAASVRGRKGAQAAASAPAPAAPKRVKPGTLAPERPARSAKLAAAEGARARGEGPRPVRGMTEEEFRAQMRQPPPTAAEAAARREALRAQGYATPGPKLSRFTGEEAASLPTAGFRIEETTPVTRRPTQRSRVRAADPMGLGTAAGTEVEAIEAVEETPIEAPQRQARVPRAGDRVAARAARRTERHTHTQGLPDEVEAEVASMMVGWPAPEQRPGVVGGRSGRTFVRPVDVPANAPVFSMADVEKAPLLKRGGFGKTRAPLIEQAKVSPRIGWIREIGCVDARYEKAGIALLVNGKFSGRWASSWEAAEDIARRMLEPVARANPRRPHAPLSARRKGRSHARSNNWVPMRGTRR